MEIQKAGSKSQGVRETAKGIWAKGGSGKRVCRSHAGTARGGIRKGYGYLAFG